MKDQLSDEGSTTSMIEAVTIGAPLLSDEGSTTSMIEAVTIGIPK